MDDETFPKWSNFEEDENFQQLDNEQKTKVFDAWETADLDRYNMDEMTEDSARGLSVSNAIQRKSISADYEMDFKKEAQTEMGGQRDGTLAKIRGSLNTDKALSFYRAGQEPTTDDSGSYYNISGRKVMLNDAHLDWLEKSDNASDHKSMEWEKRTTYNNGEAITEINPAVALKGFDYFKEVVRESGMSKREQIQTLANYGNYMGAVASDVRDYMFSKSKNTDTIGLFGTEVGESEEHTERDGKPRSGFKSLFTSGPRYFNSDSEDGTIDYDTNEFFMDNKRARAMRKSEDIVISDKMVDEFAHFYLSKRGVTGDISKEDRSRYKDMLKDVLLDESSTWDDSVTTRKASDGRTIVNPNLLATIKDEDLISVLEGAGAKESEIEDYVFRANHIKEATASKAIESYLTGVHGKTTAGEKAHETFIKPNASNFRFFYNTAKDKGYTDREMIEKWEETLSDPTAHMAYMAEMSRGDLVEKNLRNLVRPIGFLGDIIQSFGDGKDTDVDIFEKTGRFFRNFDDGARQMPGQFGLGLFGTLKNATTGDDSIIEMANAYEQLQNDAIAYEGGAAKWGKTLGGEAGLMAITMGTGVAYRAGAGAVTAAMTGQTTAKALATRSLYNKTGAYINKTLYEKGGLWTEKLLRNQSKVKALSTMLGTRSFYTIQASRSLEATYRQAYESYEAEGIAQGMNPEQASNDARFRAMGPALVSGMVTGALMKIIPGGTEKVFEKMGGLTFRQAKKSLGLDKQLWTKAMSNPEFKKNAQDLLSKSGGKIFAEGGREGLEEFTDELLQGIVAQSTYDPDMTMGEAFAGAWEAALAGVIIGTSVNAVNPAVNVDSESMERLIEMRKIASDIEGFAPESAQVIADAAERQQSKFNPDNLDSLTEDENYWIRAEDGTQVEAVFQNGEFVFPTGNELESGEPEMASVSPNQVEALGKDPSEVEQAEESVSVINRRTEVLEQLDAIWDSEVDENAKLSEMASLMEEAKKDPTLKGTDSLEYIGYQNQTRIERLEKQTGREAYNESRLGTQLGDYERSVGEQMEVAPDSDAKSLIESKMRSREGLTDFLSNQFDSETTDLLGTAMDLVYGSASALSQVLEGRQAKALTKEMSQFQDRMVELSTKLETETDPVVKKAIKADLAKTVSKIYNSVSNKLTKNFSDKQSDLLTEISSGENPQLNRLAPFLNGGNEMGDLKLPVFKNLSGLDKVKDTDTKKYLHNAVKNSGVARSVVTGKEVYNEAEGEMYLEVSDLLMEMNEAQGGGLVSLNDLLKTVKEERILAEPDLIREVWNDFLGSVNLNEQTGNETSAYTGQVESKDNLGDLDFESEQSDTLDNTENAALVSFESMTEAINDATPIPFTEVVDGLPGTNEEIVEGYLVGSRVAIDEATKRGVDEENINAALEGLTFSEAELMQQLEGEVPSRLQKTRETLKEVSDNSAPTETVEPANELEPYEKDMLDSLTENWGGLPKEAQESLYQAMVNSTGKDKVDKYLESREELTGLESLKADMESRASEVGEFRTPEESQRLKVIELSMIGKTGSDRDALKEEKEKLLAKPVKSGGPIEFQDTDPDVSKAKQIQLRLVGMADGPEKDALRDELEAIQGPKPKFVSVKPEPAPEPEEAPSTMEEDSSVIEESLSEPSIEDTDAPEVVKNLDQEERELVEDYTGKPLEEVTEQDLVDVAKSEPQRGDESLIAGLTEKLGSVDVELDQGEYVNLLIGPGFTLAVYEAEMILKSEGQTTELDLTLFMEGEAFSKSESFEDFLGEALGYKPDMESSKSDYVSDTLAGFIDPDSYVKGLREQYEVYDMYQKALSQSTTDFETFEVGFDGSVSPKNPTDGKSIEERLEADPFNNSKEKPFWDGVDWVKGKLKDGANAEDLLVSAKKKLRASFSPTESNRYARDYFFWQGAVEYLQGTRTNQTYTNNDNGESIRINEATETLSTTQDGREQTSDSNNADQSQREGIRPTRSSGDGVSEGRPQSFVVGGELLPSVEERVGADRYHGQSKHPDIENWTLSPQQIIGINLGLAAYFRGDRGFLNGDGPGFGKTSQILAIAHAISQAEGEGVVIVVTENVDILNDAFKKESAAMGIDGDISQGKTEYENSKGKMVKSANVLTGPDSGIIYTTYSALGTEAFKQTLAKAGNKVKAVAYDEAHNMKDPNSGKSRNAANIQADFKLFATATPNDKWEGASYFFAEIFGISVGEAANRLGLQAEYSQKTGKLNISKMKGVDSADVARNILETTEEAIRKGAYVRRAQPFWGDTDTQRVTDSPHSLTEEQKNQEAAFAKYLEQKGGDAGPMLRVSQLNLFTETLKTEAAVLEVEQALANGEQVVLFGESNSGRVESLADYGMSDARGGLRRVVDRLRERGHDVGEIIGDPSSIKDSLSKYNVPDNHTGNTPKKRGELIQDFQSGNLKIIAGTPGSMSTGISLDDSQGIAPRTAIILTKPMGGDKYEQMTGRISRKKTQTPSKTRFVQLSNSEADNDRQRILDEKQIVLGSLRPTGKDVMVDEGSPSKPEPEPEPEQAKVADPEPEPDKVVDPEPAEVKKERVEAKKETVKKKQTTSKHGLHGAELVAHEEFLREDRLGEGANAGLPITVADFTKEGMPLRSTPLTVAEKEVLNKLNTEIAESYPLTTPETPLALSVLSPRIQGPIRGKIGKKVNAETDQEKIDTMRYYGRPSEVWNDRFVNHPYSMAAALMEADGHKIPVPQYFRDNPEKINPGLVLTRDGKFVIGATTNFKSPDGTFEIASKARTLREINDDYVDTTKSAKQKAAAKKSGIKSPSIAAIEAWGNDPSGLTSEELSDIFGEDSENLATLPMLSVVDRVITNREVEGDARLTAIYTGVADLGIAVLKRRAMAELGLEGKPESPEDVARLVDWFENNYGTNLGFKLLVNRVLKRGTDGSMEQILPKLFTKKLSDDGPLSGVFDRPISEAIKGSRKSSTKEETGPDIAVVALTPELENRIGSYTDDATKKIAGGGMNFEAITLGIAGDREVEDFTDAKADELEEDGYFDNFSEENLEDYDEDAPRGISEFGEDDLYGTSGFQVDEDGAFDWDQYTSRKANLDMANPETKKQLDELGLKHKDPRSLQFALQKIVRGAKEGTYPEHYGRIAALLSRSIDFNSVGFELRELTGDDSQAAALIRHGKDGSRTIILDPTKTNGRGVHDMLIHELAHAHFDGVVTNPTTAQQEAFVESVDLQIERGKQYLDRMENSQGRLAVYQDRIAQRESENYSIKKIKSQLKRSKLEAAKGWDEKTSDDDLRTLFYEVRRVENGAANMLNEVMQTRYAFGENIDAYGNKVGEFSQVYQRREFIAHLLTDPHFQWFLREVDVETKGGSLFTKAMRSLWWSFNGQPDSSSTAKIMEDTFSLGSDKGIRSVRAVKESGQLHGTSPAQHETAREYREDINQYTKATNNLTSTDNARIVKSVTNEQIRNKIPGRFTEFVGSRTDRRRGEEFNEVLEELAKEKGMVVQSFGLETEDFDLKGGEHHVLVDTESGIVHKFTGVSDAMMQKEGVEPFSYGISMALDPVTDRPIPGYYENGTPYEYLLRWDWHNYLFNDDVRLVHASKEGAFHITQPFYTAISEDELSREQITEWAEDNGWTKIIDGTLPEHDVYLHQETGVMATDLKAKNFGRRDDGSLQPIDPVLFLTKDTFPPNLAPEAGESQATLAMPDPKVLHNNKSTDQLPEDLPKALTEFFSGFAIDELNIDETGSEVDGIQWDMITQETEDQSAYLINGSFHRTPDGQYVLEWGEMYLADPDAKPKTSGMPFSVSVMERLKDNPDVIIITTEASRLDGDTGYFTWPSMGFDSVSAIDWTKLKSSPTLNQIKKMKELAGSEGSLLNLVSTKEGARLWKAHGFSIPVYMPVHSGKGREVFNKRYERLKQRYDRQSGTSRVAEKSRGDTDRTQQTRSNTDAEKALGIRVREAEANRVQGPNVYLKSNTDDRTRRRAVAQSVAETAYTEKDRATALNAALTRMPLEVQENLNMPDSYGELISGMVDDALVPTDESSETVWQEIRQLAASGTLGEPLARQLNTVLSAMSKAYNITPSFGQETSDGNGGYRGDRIYAYQAFRELGLSMHPQAFLDHKEAASQSGLPLMTYARRYLTPEEQGEVQQSLQWQASKVESLSDFDSLDGMAAGMTAAMLKEDLSSTETQASRFWFGRDPDKRGRLTGEAETQTAGVKDSLELPQNRLGRRFDKLSEAVSVEGNLGKVLHPVRMELMGRLTKVQEDASFYDRKIRTALKRYAGTQDLLELMDSSDPDMRQLAEDINVTLGSPNEDIVMDESFPATTPGGLTRRQQLLEDRDQAIKAASSLWAKKFAKAKALTNTGNPGDVIAAARLREQAIATRRTTIEMINSDFYTKYRQLFEDSAVKFGVKQNAARKRLLAKDKELFRAVTGMRQVIDNLQSDVQASGLIKNSASDNEHLLKNLELQIDASKGFYLTRSYQGLDQSKNWRTFLESMHPEAQKRWEDGYLAFKEELEEDKVKEILQANPNVSRASAVASVKRMKLVTEEQILERMRNFLDSFVKSGSPGLAPGSVNVKVLQPRNVDLKKGQRDFVGQYEDNIFNASRTASTLGSMLANHNFLSGIKTILEQKQTEAENAGSETKFISTNDEGGKLVPFVPAKVSRMGGTKSYGPLANLYGPPEIVEALNMIQPSELGKWHKGVMTFAAQTMANMTTRRLRTHVRNYIGNPMFLITAGMPGAGLGNILRRNGSGSTAFIKALSKSDTLPDKFTSLMMKALSGKAPEALSDGMQTLLSEYALLGITGQDVHVGNYKELAQATGTAGLTDPPLGAFSPGVTQGTYTDKIKKVGLGVDNDLMDFYQAGDDYWKIVAYETTLKELSKAFGLTLDKSSSSKFGPEQLRDSIGTLDNDDLYSGPMSEAQADEILKVFPVVTPEHTAILNRGGKRAAALTALRKEAAKRVHKTMPNYNNTFEVVKWLKRNGATAVAAPFISFQAEIARIMVDTPKLAIEEIKLGQKTGNKGISKMGYKRAMGFMFTVGASSTTAILGAQTLFALAQSLGDDDDENPQGFDPKELFKNTESRRMKRFVSKYFKDGTVAVLSTNNDDFVTWMDLSYMLPHSTMTDPAMMILNGIMDPQTSLITSLERASSKFMSPYLSEQMWISALRDAQKDSDTITGELAPRPLWTSITNSGEQLRKIVVPGTLTDWGKLLKAKSQGGASFRHGAKTDFWDELGAQLLGTKVVKTSIPYQYEKNINKWGTGLREATRPLTSLVHNRTTLSDSDMKEAHAKAEQLHRQVFVELRRDYLSAQYFGKKFGKPEMADEVLSANKAVSKDMKSRIRSGIYKPWRPSDSTMRRAGAASKAINNPGRVEFLEAIRGRNNEEYIYPEGF